MPGLPAHPHRADNLFIVPYKPWFFDLWFQVGWSGRSGLTRLLEAVTDRNLVDELTQARHPPAQAPQESSQFFKYQFIAFQNRYCPITFGSRRYFKENALTSDMAQEVPHFFNSTEILVEMPTFL